MNSVNLENEEEIKYKVDLNNLKNNYFLMNLFDILQKQKSLKIIKYNKKIQKRLNLSINNYKEYSEQFTTIEIEIMPVKDEYGKFINRLDVKDYYHIYFNNRKEEINRNYITKDDNVSTIKIIIDHPVKSFKNLFYYCLCIESINFKKFYRNNIIEVNSMFLECQLLKELIIPNFNTNNVTDMSYMFSGCLSLKEMNLSNFNTNNVTNMSGMFFRCSSLEKLNLSNFNTNNVTDMNYMFRDCSSLIELNLSNFKTNRVNNMSGMFYGCSSLKELNLCNFRTNKTTKMSHMFNGCSEELKNKIRAQNKYIKI